MGGYKIPRKASVTEFARAVGLKTIAQDAEPEEIMEMVDELVEEKKQEQYDDEPVIIEHETEEKVSDEDVDKLKEEIAEVKDAIYSILAKDESSCDEDEVEEEKVEEEEEDDDSLASLDELEEELNTDDEVEEEDEVEQVEEHEVQPEEINDEDLEEEDMTTDSIVQLSRVLKPIIASIPDQKKRKKVADNLAGVLREHAKKAKDSKKSNYSKLINRSIDSQYDDVADIGNKIAEKFNPHYKKEVK